VAPETAAAFERMLVRRMQHEPVQYILGHADFFGLRLLVSPDVLIPRPETEQVVESALERIALWDAPRVLDVGTGSELRPFLAGPATRTAAPVPKPPATGRPWPRSVPAGRTTRQKCCGPVRPGHRRSTATATPWI
jgi:hypothetical protein